MLTSGETALRELGRAGVDFREVDWQHQYLVEEQLKNDTWDLVHAHPFAARTLGWRLAQRQGVPLILTIHGNYLDNVEAWGSYVSGCVAVSTSHAENIRGSRRIDGDRVHVIHNGVRDDYLALPPRSLDAKLAGGSVRIAMASRLDPDKQAATLALAQVLDLVRTQLPHYPIRVTIMGDGKAYSEVRKQVHQLLRSYGHAEAEFCGWSTPDEVSETFRNAVVTVGSGRAAILSLAVGTPVYAFGSQGLYGLQAGRNLRQGAWGNFGGTPLKQAPDAIESWPSLLTSRSAYEDVVEAGRECVRDGFLQSQVDSLTAALYDSLTSR